MLPLDGIRELDLTQNHEFQDTVTQNHELSGSKKLKMPPIA